MNRYIDADKLIDDLEHDIAIDQDQILYVGIDMREKELIQFDKDCKQNCIDMLSKAPTADVRENVRGEWLDSRANLYDKKHVYKQCSNCGTGFIYGVVMPKRPDGEIPVHTQFHNYCPNCGADMRGQTYE